MPSGAVAGVEGEEGDSFVARRLQVDRKKEKEKKEMKTETDTEKEKEKEKEKQGPKRHKPWPIQKITYSQDSCRLKRQLQTFKTVTDFQHSCRLSRNL